ncbi:flagellar biosynthesis regulator FlaF [Parvularcula dongshanensis]|uniref:Flagellar protein FlaF n=1 Tax=Parvularcula dongshanensis TaxID=1173995 RepID=A0A840I443_9PROT|nr:flagellar biosynthesis regulator FlaF [Parvularcula dongshanensis]MBB4659639.1 flagellar protein FlaF [Parvularcula dongshanensis]
MYSDAQAGYAQARRQTLSPRGAERALLLELAGQLGRDEQPFTALADAVHRNVQLWTTLATDLSSPQNALPPEIRGSLLSLAGFVLRHSNGVLSESADAKVLADINRQVAAGLAAPTREKAA